MTSDLESFEQNISSETTFGFLSSLTLKDGYIICQLISSFVAVLLNVTVLLLTFTTKNRVLRNYCAVIWIGVAGDTLYSIVHFIVIPVIEVRKGHMYYINLGVFANLSYPYNFLSIAFWLTACYNSIAALAMQFIYRYSALCRIRPFTIAEYIGIYSIGATMSLLLGFYCFICHEDETPVHTEIFVGESIFGLGKPGYIVGDPNDMLSMTHFLGSQMMMIILYIIIFKTYRMIEQRLKQDFRNMSAHTMHAHEVLSTVMKLQATYPFVIIGMPIFVSTILTMLKLDCWWSGLYVCTSSSLISIINPLTVITQVPWFKQQLLWVFTRKKVNIYSTNISNTSLPTNVEGKSQN
ncbi:unnamed protein product [Bursaphelenchus xylophilus]|uniref:(pine wood nematode) hypothetical protein n=1 Tax=Bursaphelenchus xylophilus TaxID=6326 RepID=A0A1I7RIK3_BURXY|nr:unnamed protein product [Bursaphelenchus xylophilus]CAG9118841.1 unnamed protein product [Bursaphelenchus xylophilus]